MEISNSLNRKDLIVKGSIGQENRTKYPWVSILNRNITTLTQEGLYIVYLFKKDMLGFYLSLNQGITHFENRFKNKKYDYVRKVVDYYKSELIDYKDIKDYSFESINLGAATKDLGYGYQQANIISRYYEAFNYTEDMIVNDLKNMIELYDYIFKHMEFSYNQIIDNVLQDHDEKLLNADDAIMMLKDVEEIYNAIPYDLSVNLMEVKPQSEKTGIFKKFNTEVVSKKDYIKKTMEDAKTGLRGEEDMKDLKYIVEDNEVIELFGRQSFATKESAILELVKNAFDAASPNLIIDIQYNDKNKYLMIIDEGNGMSSYDIETRWIRVGVSDKGYDFIDNDGKKRVYSGQKGVGRFALARLGGKIELFSKKRYEEAVVWITDWNYNRYDFPKSTVISNGTKIIITDLRDKWSNRDYLLLVDYLRRTCNNIDFSIKVKYNDEMSIIKNVFENPEAGKNYSERIKLEYFAKYKKLKISIFSDEFKKNIDELTDIDVSSHYKEICLSDLEDIDYDEEKDEKVILDELSSLGDFDCDLFFSLDTTSEEDVTKFNYKYRTIPDRFKTGIVLYRNSFSISSYDGKKDWLELNKRVRKSPAAASHKTGAWRVRANQISGCVNIDKKTNDKLMDLANRQGLEENEYYDLFTQIILLGIAEFEWFRQNIVRKIVSASEEQTEEKKTFTDEILNNPKILLDLNSKNLKEVVARIKTEKKIEKRQESRRKGEIESLYYDIRMLNSLSTIGLKSSSIAHEIENDKKFLLQFNEKVREVLKEKGFWEELGDSKEFYKNIPKLLGKSEKIISKLISFLETNLELVEINNFDRKDINLGQILLDIKKRWESDYRFVNITIVEDNPIENIYFYEDVLNVIFDNLILNSVQQNKNIPSLSISIKFEVFDDKIKFHYNDNGKGLSPKYFDKPERILEPHETTRRKSGGHGLGMWIVNNTVNYTGGTVTHIGVLPGFDFQFELGRSEE